MKTILVKSKYLMLIAVFGLLVTHFFALAWATLKSYDTWAEIISTVGRSEKIIVYLVKVVDGFLIAFVLYLLAASIYRMTIGELDVLDNLTAKSLSELKTKLSSIMVLVLGIRFIEILFSEEVSGQQLLYSAGAIAIVGSMLIAFSAFGKGSGEH